MTTTVQDPTTVVAEVLDEAVKNNEVFTHFDITTMARSLTSSNIRHNEVRVAIDNAFQMGEMNDYNRELCELTTGGSPEAIVYFPNDKASSDHPLVDSTTGVNIDGDDFMVDDDDDSTDDTLADGEYKLTADGRLEIPLEMLRKINLVASSYDILINNSVVSFKPNDCRGAVRFTPSKYGIAGDKVKLTVNVSQDTITVESV